MSVDASREMLMVRDGGEHGSGGGEDGEVKEREEEEVEDKSEGSGSKQIVTIGGMSMSVRGRTKTRSILDATLSKSKARLSRAKTGAQRALGNLMRKTMSRSHNLPMPGLRSSRAIDKADNEQTTRWSFLSLASRTIAAANTDRDNATNRSASTLALSNALTLSDNIRKKNFGSFLSKVNYVGDQVVDENDVNAEEKLRNYINAQAQSRRREEVFDTSLDDQPLPSAEIPTSAGFISLDTRTQNNSITGTASVSGDTSYSSHSLQRYKTVEQEIPNIEKTIEERGLILKALTSNLFFNDLTEEEIELVTRAMDRYSIRKGDTLFTEEQVGDICYIISKGKLSLSKKGSGCGELGVGSCLGESALLYRSPRQNTATAIENCELFLLSKLVYRQIVAFSESDRIENIRKALLSVPLLESLSKEQVYELAENVQTVKFKQGDPIIVKGSAGDVFYIIKRGTVRCTKIGDNEKIKDLVLGPNDYFGERALLKNEARAANVIALEPVDCLAIGREAFTEHLGPLVDILNSNLAFRALKAMPLLSHLTDKQLMKLIGTFTTETFKPGALIIEQGMRNRRLYIIINGTVDVTLFSENDRDKHTKLDELTPGDYFGESSLQTSAVANAEVTAKDEVTCFVADVTIKKNAKLLKPLTKTIKKNQTLRNKKTEEVYKKNSGRIELSMMLEEFEHVRTLGTGTFGRVKLVEHKRSGNVYALKILQKAYVAQYKQQQNVLNEKLVMMKSDHPFILKLFRTFQSKNCLYFLLEYVPGGELFSLLHLHGGAMKAEQAKFYASNVLDALCYLHNKQICYRDLKPENLLIDAEGYIRMVDFGFAKKVTTRTYTLCGTPEYLAPESIQSKGHNRAVDYWALGVLIYEMIAGFSPFSDYEKNTQDDIFERILGGKFGFTTGFPSNAKDLVKRLVVKNFRERLGMFKDGAEEIKKHSWFSTIDFEKLVQKSIKAPWEPSIEGSTDTQHFEHFDEDDSEISYKGSNRAWATF